MWRSILLTALVVVPWSAQAFASVEKGESPHDEITGVVADLGWPKDAVEALQAAVRQPDLDDLGPAPVEGNKDRMDVTVTFRPWHHCDRVAPATDDEAVNATIAYVAHERDLAENLSLVDPEAAVGALGRALHAMQDCFSHTDVVDLPAEAQQSLAQAFLRAGARPPPLRVCGSQPGALDIERPAGDPYAHADHNKDDAKSSPEAEVTMADGRSKFEHARDLASNATRAFVLDFMGRLDADESARLLDVKPDKAAGHGRGIPALEAVGALAARALAAGRRRT